MKAIDAKQLTEKTLDRPWTLPFLEAIYKAIRIRAGGGGFHLSDPLFTVPAKVMATRRGKDFGELWEALEDDGYVVELGKRAWETRVSWAKARVGEAEEDGAAKDAKDAKDAKNAKKGRKE